jgi:hypothetical protein
MTEINPERTCGACGGHKFFRSRDDRHYGGYRWRCSDCRNKTRRAYWKRDHEKHKEWSRTWAARRAPVVKYQRRKLKEELIAAYGGVCRCCGESEVEFLTLEHINKDGAAHRRSLVKVGPRGGYQSWHSVSTKVYLDLKARGFPKDNYCLLCWNCHMASRYDSCPHQRKQNVQSA